MAEAAFDPASAPAFDATKPFDPADAPPFDPSKTAKPETFMGHMKGAVTDIPHEAYQATADALGATNDYLNPFSKAFRAGAEKGMRGEGDWTGPGTFLGTGKGLLAAASIPFSPFLGGARAPLGHGMAAITPGMTYQEGKDAADVALMGLGPRAGGRAPVPVPSRPAPGPLGVTLSEGQQTGALPLIQREQAAGRGQLGEAAQTRAQEFIDQQRGQVQSATERVQQGFDPFGQTVAETPQQAGQLVSEGVQNAARQAKAGVTQAYDYAKAQPGEIHAGAFEGIGQKIKGELSLGDNPIIIDDKLTPFASRAIQDIENRVSKLQIQNRADPFGQPNPENIVGVDLKGVDQMRKRLSAFRSDAFSSGNAADGRAAQAAIKAFDNQIDSAVNGGLFNGSPMAIQAWNDARAAHADYKGTFAAGKNDPTGRVVEKILGKRNNPAAIPNDVADFMYGGSGVNPSSLNVNVANRIKGILGEQSPEWTGVKQGLFARIVDPGPGVTDWGPGKIAQRVNKFLNVDGLELSKEVFSPTERALIQQYGELQRKLEVPQAGANWSGTGTALTPILKKISGGVAAVVGAILGHTFAPGLYGIGEAAGAAGAAKVSKTISEARQMRQIAEQMPLVAEQARQWQRAVAAANRANSSLPSQQAMSVATANLSASLSRMGLDPTKILGQLQGMSPVHADQQQQP